MSRRPKRKRSRRTPRQSVLSMKLEEVRLHPALEELSDIRTPALRRYTEFPPAAVVCPVVILSEKDAARLGEPENARTVLIGHQRILAAREGGRAWVAAEHAKIPTGCGVREFVLRDFLQRIDLTVGQRAVVAAELKAALIEKARHLLGPDADVQDDLTEEDARQVSAEVVDASVLPRMTVEDAERLLAEHPDLAGRLRRCELELHEACEMAERREETGQGATGRSSLKNAVGTLDRSLRELLETADLTPEDRRRTFESIEDIQAAIDELGEVDGPDQNEVPPKKNESDR